MPNNEEMTKNKTLKHIVKPYDKPEHIYIMKGVLSVCLFVCLYVP